MIESQNVRAISYILSALRRVRLPQIYYEHNMEVSVEPDMSFFNRPAYCFTEPRILFNTDKP